MYRRPRYDQIQAGLQSDLNAKTTHPLLPGAIAEFNRYEFNAMRFKDCRRNQVYSAYRALYGRAGKIMNTNGAGDAALSALYYTILRQIVIIVTRT